MKRLLLLGGGHSHLFVLEVLARKPIPDVQVTLISPYPRQIYSGMLPGWVAGYYALDECAIALDRIAARAGCEFRLSHAVALQLQERCVACADGERVGYDLLSIDSGSTSASATLPGAARNAVAVRPIEEFVARWSAFVASAPRRGRVAVTVVGGGAAGVELALAAQHGLTHAGARCAVRIIASGKTILEGHAAAVRRRITRILERNNVELCAANPAVRFDEGSLVLNDGRTLASDFTLLATGPAAPTWPRESGLQTDPAGFIAVNHCLQSLSHADVFAAGDVAMIAGQPRPKSGVYAVRAGPPLAHNLRCSLSGAPLLRHVAQRHALYLIGTGGRDAVASWGGLAWSGAWVWRWKQRIDRRFVRARNAAAQA